LRIEDLKSEAADNFVVGGLRRADQFVSEPVGVNDLGAELGEHLGDRALPGGHAAGQTECAAECIHGKYWQGALSD
jgi:hypothetical protein